MWYWGLISQRYHAKLLPNNNCHPWAVNHLMHIILHVAVHGKDNILLQTKLLARIFLEQTIHMESDPSIHSSNNQLDQWQNIKLVPEVAFISARFHYLTWHCILVFTKYSYCLIHNTPHLAHHNLNPSFSLLKYSNLIWLVMSILVFTKSVNSNYCAFWLTPVTQNIFGYSLFCDWSQDGISFRDINFSKDKIWAINQAVIRTKFVISRKPWPLACHCLLLGNFSC